MPKVHYLGLGFPSVCRKALSWLAKSGVRRKALPFFPSKAPERGPSFLSKAPKSKEQPGAART